MQGGGRGARHQRRGDCGRPKRPRVWSLHICCPPHGELLWGEPWNFPRVHAPAGRRTWVHGPAGRRTWVHAADRRAAHLPWRVWHGRRLSGASRGHAFHARDAISECTVAGRPAEAWRAVHVPPGVHDPAPSVGERTLVFQFFMVHLYSIMLITF